MIVTKIDNPKKSASKAERVGRLADYITAPENTNSLEKCIHSECINFITDDYQSQKMEMLALADGAVKSKDPIDHWVMSWQPHERPTVEQARQAVELFMKHAGLEGHQHIWGLHDDTDNRHLHLQINRVNPESLKVTKINKGFWKETGQQVACIVEHKQGWESVKNARYYIENGKLIKRDEAAREAKPDSVAQAREIQTGEKSAQRIGIEEAGPVIQNARTWGELHAALAKLGMRYEQVGSGAKIYVGEVGVKASDVDRKASLGALQKRLGQFQSAGQQEINRNDYHHHTAQPHAVANGPRTANRMRSLSECTLAHSEKGEYGKTKREGVLQLDARPDRQRNVGVRRDAGRSTGRSEPLKTNQPGWDEYKSIRDERRAAKSVATTELRMKHDAERRALTQAQRAERERSIGSVNWKGKGLERNVASSALAISQAAEKLELQARQKAERQALQGQYPALPQYKAWAEQPRLVKPLELAQEKPQALDQEQPSQVAGILRTLDKNVARDGFITYRSAGRDVFRDEGRSIKILDLKSDTHIAAAVAAASAKFGGTLTVTGSPEFQRRAVAVAVANGIQCRFVDPALDQLREQLQQQKYQVDRQRNADRQAAEKTRITAQMVKEPEAMPNRTPQAAPIAQPALPSLAERWNAKPATEMTGPIVAVEGSTVIQAAGQGRHVVHELAPNSPIPEVSDEVRTIKDGVLKRSPKEFAQELVRQAQQKEAEKEADKIIAGREISPKDRAALVDMIRKDQAEDRQLQQELSRQISRGQGLGR